jgi:hypothetical protein
MKTVVKAATVLSTVAAAMLLAGPAQAVPVDLGSIANGTTFTQLTADGAFQDLFTFTVAPNQGGAFALTAIAGNNFGVSLTNASLYTGNFTMPSALDPGALLASSGPVLGTNIPNTSIVVSVAIGSTPLILSPLTTYTLSVAGSSVGPSAYTGNVLLAPVPEPETYAMLLAGLGMMGMIARRRQKHR